MPLDPVVRARLMLALLGIVILGLFLILIVRWGSFFVRRRLRKGLRRSRLGPDNWAARRFLRRKPNRP
jgi:hypothetical protein